MKNKPEVVKKNTPGTNNTASKNNVAASTVNKGNPGGNIKHTQNITTASAAGVSNSHAATRPPLKPEVSKN